MDCFIPNSQGSYCHPQRKFHEGPQYAFPVNMQSCARMDRYRLSSGTSCHYYWVTGSLFRKVTWPDSLQRGQWCILWWYLCYVLEKSVEIPADWLVELDILPLTKHPNYPLTHWGRVTHICIGKLTIIGSYNGLSPGRRQAIIWTNAGILLISPLGTNFSEILIEIHTFSFNNIHLKMSSVKWRPFCLCLNVLNNYVFFFFSKCDFIFWCCFQWMQNFCRKMAKHNEYLVSTVDTDGLVL